MNYWPEDKKLKEAIWNSYIEMMTKKIKPDDGYLIIGAKHIEGHDKARK